MAPHRAIPLAPNFRVVQRSRRALPTSAPPTMHHSRTRAETSPSCAGEASCWPGGPLRRPRLRADACPFLFNVPGGRCN